MPTVYIVESVCDEGGVTVVAVYANEADAKKHVAESKKLRNGEHCIEAFPIRMEFVPKLSASELLKEAEDILRGNFNREAIPGVTAEFLKKLDRSREG